jgi:pimeloyl-ACP methyl ester carboxylesterase
VLQGFGQYLSELLGGNFDVVGFDPRGVGSSAPLFCLQTDEEFLDLIGETPWYPYQPEQERPYFDAWSELGERCDEDRMRQHMSTADAARDLDRLREALGEEHLDYLGFSYGSFLGSTYANLFPENLGTFVVDGVVDPALYSAGLDWAPNSVSIQDELDEVLRLCDEAGSDCALSGEGGSGALYDVIEYALLEEPLDLGERGLYYYDQFIGDTVGSLYDPEVIWPGPNGVAALFRALYESVLGEPGAIERTVAIFAAIEEAWAEPEPFAAKPNPVDAFHGVRCSDTEFPEPFEEHSNTGIVSGRVSELGAYWWWGNAGCARLPLADDRYAGPWTAETSSPVLVVGNYFDGITDYTGAVEAAGLLPNSRLLSYAGLGHTVLGRNGCATDHIVSFFQGGVLPPEGTVCPANPNPFIAPEAEVSSGRAGAARSANLPWLAALRARQFSRGLLR